MPAKMSTLLCVLLPEYIKYVLHNTDIAKAVAEVVAL
jgi:hypothetical protein